MNGMLVDGKKIAAQIEARLAKEVRTLRAQPHLVVVLVGDDPASAVYVRKKQEAAERVGIKFSLYTFASAKLQPSGDEDSTLPASSSQEEILTLIQRLNRDQNVSGIIVQLPLPEGLDEGLIISRISSEKDVDGLNPHSRFVPATAGAVLEVLRRQKVNISGARAVVIGRGKVAGMPIALALLANDATVTIAHSKTKNLAELTRQADILVSAVGQPHFIKPAMVKRGATVLDVGISRLPAQAGVDGKLYGDVDPAVEKKARFLTPVPGGIGPLTVVNLLENIFHAWKLQHMR